MTFIDNCRQWWKLWSIRLNLIGSTILAAIIGFPDVGLALWNMMPVELKDLLGPRAVLAVPLTFFLLATGARFLKQRKLTDGDQ